MPSAYHNQHDQHFVWNEALTQLADECE